MTIENTKILLVDDHQILIDGIKNMLEEKGFIIVNKAYDTLSALEFLEKYPVEIIITDISMPGEDGIELIKKVKKLYPEIKIIVLSMHEEKGIVQDAIQLGVNGYILKNITQQQLLRAIQRVKEDKFYISEEIAHILVENIHDKTDTRLLSKRELEILKLIAREYSNKHIAETLFISERTVETHRKNIFRKTNTHTVVGLIKYAIENKLI
ncbi:MAG: hypothetical protein A2X08_10875 [Bacteroidetes bacterium GWA2_32_17]|nr:MAG: hypothetical protein A2X08_10875 [Bacteroidetes bacterium GWA2_32_17]